MKKILLDTNFLVAPFQLNIALFEELERLYPYAKIYTIDDAVQEAKSIKGGKYGDMVVKLLKTEDVEILETTGEGTVDDLLVNLSDDFVIATNDQELRERLLEKNAEIIIIRTKDHLKVKNREGILE